MDTFSEELNNILVDTFRSILKVEEQLIKSTGKIDLSISELHLVESVGKNIEKGRTISDIADDLDITLPSVTVAINKLVKKGYVQKEKCLNDGRVVYVSLTDQGKRINAVHQYFHIRMVRAVTKDLSEDEKSIMLNGIIKLDNFFKNKLEHTEEQP